MRAGVPAELHVYPGAFHAFNLMPGARTAEAARRDSREALRRALHGYGDGVRPRFARVRSREIA